MEPEEPHPAVEMAAEAEMKEGPRRYPGALLLLLGHGGNANEYLSGICAEDKINVSCAGLDSSKSRIVRLEDTERIYEGFALGFA